MKTRNEVKERYRLETKREVNMPLGDDFSYTDKYVEWLEQMIVKNCSIHSVSKPFNTRLETSDGTFNLTLEELKRWEDDGYCEKGSKFYGTVLIKEF